MRRGRGGKHVSVRLLVSAFLLAVVACASDGGKGSARGAPLQPVPAALPDTPSSAPVPAASVDADRAMRYLREVVAFGSRPPGSSAHSRLEEYLRRQLSGDDLEEDSFTAHTPVGEIPMRNFIAKFPGKKDGIIVIAGHYDTNYGIEGYVGANDGGSSTALLLELARHFRSAQPRDGYSVWLVWLDGEEAIREWGPRDGLYGSRHLAEKWQQDGTLAKTKALLVVDMIGDADLNIDRDLNSTPWLLDLVGTAAKRLGYGSYFYRRQLAIEDDHLPFARLKIPVADIIDLDYGYRNVYHHTRHDTLDKVSPRSLKIAGEVVLETVRLLDQR